MAILSPPNTEPLAAPEKRPLYPLGIPAKFNADGVVQRYPGNTTVCHLPASCPLLPGLRNLYTALSSHPTLSKIIYLLPPQSWHMTVFDGAREGECEPGMWPPGLEKRPLPEATADFSRRLRELGLNLEAEGLAPPYKMKIPGFDVSVVGIGLRVEGATPEEEKRMRRLRDRLAETLGFRAPNHDTYGFHISMAYLLRHADGDDGIELNRLLTESSPKVEMQIELGRVEFCTFENMLAFPRLFYLGDKEEDSISES